ncbi:MAG: aminoglycoside 3'-phosphotransferase/choline kinase family protein [Nanoarchaeota archaeon]|nr:aminoglycoside 3'-phosphotransferase/choline kinase family protein [Nanoarchaeota archaeon]MBU1322364.1 aminoglycoside 3'-phosphotransferase/choline kinase family protein [Nanoarchaeota archaeon]MBU1598391.1 aminoglycoside 3'-phosphotransferase/choline kinase family protein [Nanoarchaeota archaeon]MBU2440768.1 aminoglycoside 3'-phosphotransferase/choline kinase family protein [Nanoarchaeota archaeon]
MNKYKIKLSKKNIEDVLARVNKKVLDYKLFDHGFNNPIYFVKTKDKKTKNKQELVLRVTNPLKRWERLKTLHEVTIMDFIRENTNIPVPQVYDYSLDKKLIGYEYILMEKIKGKPLSKIYNKLSDKEKLHYLKQIAKVFAELKKFKFDKIGSFQPGMKIGPMVDIREGPFDNASDYLAAELECRLVEMKKKERFIPYIPKFIEFKEKVIKQYKPKEKFVLTHMDYALKNFMVKDGKITALIDWEWSGSFPPQNDLLNLDLDLDKFPKGKKAFENVLKKKKVQTHCSQKDIDVYTAVGIALVFIAYEHWHVSKPRKAEQFVTKYQKMLDELFLKYKIK